MSTHVQYRGMVDAYAIELTDDHSGQRHAAFVLTGAQVLELETALRQATRHGEVTIDATWYRRAQWAADWAAFQHRIQQISDEAKHRADRLSFDMLHTPQAVADRQAIAEQDARRRAARPIVPGDALSAVLRAVDAQRALNRTPQALVVSQPIWDRLTAMARDMGTYPSPGGRDTLLGLPVSVGNAWMEPDQVIVLTDEGDGWQGRRFAGLADYTIRPH